MRILLISNRFPPDVTGGAELLAGDVAAALRRRGHDVRVLTARGESTAAGDDIDVERSLRHVVNAANDSHPGAWTIVRRAMEFYRQTHSSLSARVALATIQRYQPDVVYVWNLSGIGLVSVLRALGHVQTPIVFHLHSYWWQYINSPQTQFSTVRASALKRALIGPVPPLRCSSFIATSEALKREYVRAGCPADRIDVIDNGIDVQFLRRRRGGAHRGKPVMMYAGRLCAEKGVDVLLQAVHRLVSDGRDLELRVYGYGDPAYITTLLDFVQSHGLGGHVRFMGQIERAALVDAYDAADILVVPSLWEEPFGLVALEAMARGTTVVASRVGGLPAVIRDGIDGFLVAPGDVRALADTVRMLLDDPATRRRVGAAGRAAVAERFSIDRCAERIEDHLQRARSLENRDCRYAA